MVVFLVRIRYAYLVLIVVFSLIHVTRIHLSIVVEARRRSVERNETSHDDIHRIRAVVRAAWTSSYNMQIVSRYSWFPTRSPSYLSCQECERRVSQLQNEHDHPI